ncbi:MAG TPA: MBL fold metallo-hydrolase RNA specificity domain-containing protein, partial [Candidatus Thermoplasmatota archaeon]|nr:MBL fold metallo-hydrolase RNA specificity domain-containing protein [Candidatus Thermoplasmatota archaeon]
SASSGPIVGASDVVVRVLDGEDTIGGSKILVGWGGEGVFLDFGINYGRWGQYFEEYLRPRPTHGLGDLWRLGLVPQVENLYRPDVIPPGLQPGKELPVKTINAVYVSHGHLDHAGLVGLLRTDIPVVTSRTTAAILKSIQDSGKQEIFSQSVYSSALKQESVGGQSVLRGDTERAYMGRDLFLTDGAGNAAFQRFWSEPPTRVDPLAKRKGRGPKGLDAGAIRRQQPGDGGVLARAFTVDHSVLGSSGFILESPQGPIAYSGDLRAHGERAEGTQRFLDSLKARPPWILLMEGTQVRGADPRHDGYEPAAEDEVEANSLRVVDEYRGRMVIADFAPRNIERLKAFLRIAQRTGRKLVVLPKDAYLLHGMNAADPEVPVPDGNMLVLDPPAGTEAGWEDHVLRIYDQHVIHLQDVRSRPGELILCLSYFDIKHLLDVEPDGGCYIYSSSEAHSEEQEIDMERLHNWLQLFHLTPVGFHMVPMEGGKRRKLRAVFEPGFHASGHMPGEEILDWVEQIRPEQLIPVHTEHSEQFAQRLQGSGIKILKGGLG